MWKVYFLKFDWCLTIHAHIQTTTDSCVSRLSLADGCTVNAPRLLLDWAEFGEPISLLLAKCSGTSFADLTVLENMWIQHEYEEGSEYRDIVFIVFPCPYCFVSALFAIFPVYASPFWKNITYALSEIQRTTNNCRPPVFKFIFTSQWTHLGPKDWQRQGITALEGFLSKRGDDLLQGANVF